MWAIEERCWESVQVDLYFTVMHTEARMDCESIVRGGGAQLTFGNSFKDVNSRRK
jgi:hypothetical protein